MNLLEYWETRIRSDVAPFVDPGTLLEVQRAGSVIDARWTQRRRPVSVQFVIRDADGVYVNKRGNELDYRSFFASEDMADISGIAKTSSDLLQIGLYVDTKATADGPHKTSGPAINLISDLVNKNPSNDLTSFVMVTGEAGAGKTSVLKELVRRQASAYLSGSAKFVYLYINAQGRALARFNEALSTELNELRVALPHHAVAPLVKLGLIVPVIDGFDELLGVGGYDDAFSSISSFVEDLEGMGAIVASARSTYYEQEFLSRATKPSIKSGEAWRLSTVAVEGWGIEERRSYVERKISGSPDSQPVDEIMRELNRVFSGQNEPLASKPLFIARATDFLVEGILSSTDGALLERLVDAFVLREQKEKLLKKTGQSILTSEQIKSLCSDLAEEMWNLGTRELDRTTVRDLAELALYDLRLATAEKATVIDRMPNMAFLQPGESTGSVSFEHEIFFDYFLSSRIAKSISEKSNSLTLLLGRSAMPESLAENIAQELQALDEQIVECVKTLSDSASQNSPRKQLVRENSGRVVGALFLKSRGLNTDILIQNLILPGSRLHGVTVEKVKFVNCEFRRCDLTKCIFNECSADYVSFELPLLDSATVLGISGLDSSAFSGLRIASSDGVRVIYQPQDILQILRDHGLPSAQTDNLIEIRNVDDDVIKIIDKLTRAYARCNPICVQDANLSSIFDANEWPEIERAAVESGVLKKEARAANGPRRDFLRRLVLAEDLFLGLAVGQTVPDSVTRFWKIIQDKFPAN